MRDTFNGFQCKKKFTFKWQRKVISSGPICATIVDTLKIECIQRQEKFLRVHNQQNGVIEFEIDKHLHAKVQQNKGRKYQIHGLEATKVCLDALPHP